MACKAKLTRLPQQFYVKSHVQTSVSSVSDSNVPKHFYDSMVNDYHRRMTKSTFYNLNALTCFGGSLGGKIRRKALEHLSYLLFDKEANEVGGDVELQR